MSESYTISASLVNKLIFSILGAIVSVGLYMAWWAYDDRDWKARMDERWMVIHEAIMEFENDLDRHKDAPCHREACEKFRNLEHHE